MSGFGLFDLAVLIVYLAAVTLFGIRAAGKQTSAADYFLGSRNMPWWAILFSVIATETSTLTFISIPAVAYTGNLTFLQLTFGYILGRTAVAIWLLPSYMDGRQQTVYQHLEQRFDSLTRKAAGSVFMLTRVLADGVRLFATAIPLATLFRFAGLFPHWGDGTIYVLSILIIAFITLIYTFLGGIKAVIWMDVVQMGVYLGGALIALALLLDAIPLSVSEMIRSLQVGGLESGGAASASVSATASATASTAASTTASATASTTATASATDPTFTNKLQLFRTGSGLSWSERLADPYILPVSILGGALFSVASHGTDQLIVQRLMTAKDLTSSRKALVWSGILASLQFALFLFIGLMLFLFYNGASAESLGLATTDEIFARYIVDYLPAGLGGLIIAALMAAAMSSLSSSLNALASSTTYDFLKPLAGPAWSGEREMRVSRGVTLVWGVVLTFSAFLFTWLQLSSGERPAIVELGLGIASYTYGGLLGLFLLARFTHSPTGFDARAGFFIGLMALLFLVDGPVQRMLPGEPLSMAWPLYTPVGAAIVVAVALLVQRLRRSRRSRP